MTKMEKLSQNGNQLVVGSKSRIKLCTKLRCWLNKEIFYLPQQYENSSCNLETLFKTKNEESGIFEKNLSIKHRVSSTSSTTFFLWPLLVFGRTKTGGFSSFKKPKDLNLKDGASKTCDGFTWSQWKTGFHAVSIAVKAVKEFFTKRNFLQFFSGNQRCQQLKSPKPQHVHEFFNPNLFWHFFPWNQSCQQL